MSIEKSNNLIGNGTRDLPACSIVPQPSTLPRLSVQETTVSEHMTGIQFTSRSLVRLDQICTLKRQIRLLKCLQQLTAPMICYWVPKLSAHVEKGEGPEAKRHCSGSKNFDRSILSIFVCSVVQWHLRGDGALLTRSLNTEQLQEIHPK
jgi:hypothetical protein